MPRLTPTPTELTELAARRLGYATSSECTAWGIDSTARTRRFRLGLWDHVGPGIVDLEPGRERPLHEEHLRAIHLALLRAGPDAVAIGLSALLLHGCWGLPPQFQARAARADRAFRRGGTVAQHEVFTVVDVGGVRAASVGWAIIQALPELSVLHLVAVLDWALSSDALPSLDDLLRRARKRRGCRKLNAVLDLVDGRSESFLETWARLQCVDAGIPPDVLQLPIDQPGRPHPWRGDLAWRLAGGGWLVVEIDGAAVHDSPEALYADRARQNAITASGHVVVLRFTAADLRRGGYVPAQIRAALRARNAAA